MPFTFSAMTRYALAQHGLSGDAIAALEQLEEGERKTARALRVPSAAALLRQQAKRLEREARRSKMRR